MNLKLVLGVKCAKISFFFFCFFLIRLYICIVYIISELFILQTGFLAAPSSSRSLVVGRSVGRLVGPSVRHLCEKGIFRVSDCNLKLPMQLNCDKSQKLKL